MPELAEDIARQVKANGARLVPAEGQTGYYLGVTGQNPLRYAFLQPPDDEIPRFPGSPDGELGAPIDSLVRNTDDHTVWINTDGDTAWTDLGASAGSGFPITLDDGTYTYSIVAGSGDLTIRAWANAAPLDKSIIFFDPSTGDLNITLEGGANADFNLRANRDVNIRSDGRDVNIFGDNNVDINANGDVVMAGLPLSDPSVTGALWNDSGTVKISP